MSCGVGGRRGLDLAWLWLWCRLAPVAPIRLLAWELPYALSAAVKSKQTTNKHPAGRALYANVNIYLAFAGSGAVVNASLHAFISS